MPATLACPKCRRPLPADAPQGLCPLCLFESMLKPVGEQAPALKAGGIPTDPPAGACGDYELLQVIAQ